TELQKFKGSVPIPSGGMSHQKLALQMSFPEAQTPEIF
ncbi:hypothetical protein AVEN_163738-1, partial [Araneus ventricosus]